MKKELVIKRALWLAIEFFKSNPEHNGPGIDLLQALHLYNETDVIDELIEYGALVTYCIDKIDVPIETFSFNDRNNNPYK